MSDFGDIFDMFSQDDDENKKQNKDAENDPKTQIINKILKNKVLLFTIIGVGVLVIGGAAYFLIGYISDHGAKGIIDSVAPLIK